MAKSVPEIIAAIEHFQPSNGDWRPLDALLYELFRSNSATQGIAAMLNVFERFPLEDGSGVFWSIVHGLESLDGSEPRLVESVQRAPSEFALMMVHRLMNAGYKEVDGVGLAALLEKVIHDQNVNSEIRQSAAKFHRWHR